MDHSHTCRLAALSKWYGLYLPPAAGLRESFITSPSEWQRVFDSPAPHLEHLPNGFGDAPLPSHSAPGAGGIAGGSLLDAGPPPSPSSAGGSGQGAAGNLQAGLDAFQRLLLVRCLAADKLVSATRDYVGGALGPSYVAAQELKLASVYAGETAGQMQIHKSKHLLGCICSIVKRMHNHAEVAAGYLLTRGMYPCSCNLLILLTGNLHISIFIDMRTHIALVLPLAHLVSPLTPLQTPCPASRWCSC